MKKYLLLACLLTIAIWSHAQAYEGTVSYDKKDLPAAIIELPYPPSVVDAALDEHLPGKSKSRGHDIRGFSRYGNPWRQKGDSAGADIYLKTERKSKKEKEVTVVSLLLQPDELSASEAALHHLTIEEAKGVLNDLAPVVADYNLELSIKQQTEIVTKAEAKYKDLVNEAEDLKKKRDALDKKMEENKNDQRDQLKEIDSQKKILTQYVSQRKSS